VSATPGARCAAALAREFALRCLPLSASDADAARRLLDTQRALGAVEELRRGAAVVVLDWGAA